MRAYGKRDESPRPVRWEVGGRFKRESIYVYQWLIRADVWQKLTQHVNYPPIKNKYIIFLKVG